MRSSGSQSRTRSKCYAMPVLAALSLATLGTAHAANGVIKTWLLKGGGGWDYMIVDPAKPRLFVSRATHVDVLDTGTGALLGTIADTSGVHGIALAQELHRGYTSNGKADSITVFDLDTLQTIKTAPVPGHNPDAILYEPIGKHVFTFNGKSKDVTVFDAESMTPLKTLPVGDKPEFAADDGAGKIFVNIETEPGKLMVIDSKQLTVLSTWPLPGCNSPSGLAIDRAHHRLFSVCDARVMVVTNSETGKQVAKVTIGDGPDAAAYDATRKLVYSSNSDGTMTIIQQESADRYKVLDNVATQKGARTMALDGASGLAYTVTAEFGIPPPPTADAPHPRAPPKDGTITVLVIAFGQPT